MRVVLLGTVAAISSDGSQVRIGGPRVRALLALLALDVGRAVSDTRLIDGIWDEDPPVEASNALHTLVKRLRTALPAQTVIREGAGYRLALDPAAVDARRFTDALDRGRARFTAGQPADAAVCLDEALNLWSGEPLGGTCESAGLAAAVTGLSEQRLAAIELRADAYRALGRSAELLRELRVESAAQPLRESLIARVVTALAAAGRAAEAVEEYQRAEAVLDAELGTTPSAELRTAFEQITKIAAAEPPRPPLAAPPVQPRRLTSFVGRADDVSAVIRSLQRSQLVTLIGTGGVGKTRLAIEVATALPETYTDGWLFIELAAVERAPAGGASWFGIGGALLTVLGLADGPRDDWLTVICRALSGRRLLLVLDNCEHVVDETAQLVAMLLQRLPLLTVLTTSREPLGVEGERLHPVGALQTPMPGMSAREATEYAAVQLFLDRAAAVRPDFALTEENCADVISIVRGVDGLPLAIELAAARLGTLPLREVADRLTDRFRLLTNGSRHAVPRHRTLHAAVAWSWELLTPAEAELARRFAVFAGGATVAAVLQTCPGAEIDTLTALAGKSLLEFDGERYRMAETVRAHAAAELARAVENEQLARAHADWCIEFAGQAAAGLHGPAQDEWLRRLAAEYGNCESALAWAIRTGDARRAVRLYGELLWYWRLCGRYQATSDWRRQVLELAGDAPPEGCTAAYLACRFAEQLPANQTTLWWGSIQHDVTRFDALVRAAMTEPDPPHPKFVLILAMRDHRFGDDRLLTECAAAADDGVRGMALMCRGLDALAGDTLRWVPTDLEAAVASLDRAGEPCALMHALLMLSQLRIHRDGLAAARADIARAIDLIGTDLGIAEQLGVLSIATDQLLLGDDIDNAVALLERMRTLATDVELPAPLRRFLTSIEGHLAFRQDRLDRAAELYARVFAEPLDYPAPAAGRFDFVRFANEVQQRCRYALALLDTGFPEASAVALRAARELAVPTSAVLVSEVAVAGARLAVAAGAPERAALLLGGADGLRDRADLPHRGVDRNRAEARARDALGQSGFDEPYAAGTRLSVGQVTELLGDIDVLVADAAQPDGMLQPTTIE
ncbi:BTAD domain-containing putative transcriptional regulator [Nocardia sp. CDC153]|uniref:AfsR/SARP family transcriptional regulator n=1 Tax=Nocardia sp. CDC153 TaxID=3112167 RepID=UPI002DBD3901|nr:BTAD domain-containing putative transcriptional regulator [Nocardia sp. CDC153]MEC3957603.1 BTAD domain-containing putative transcriptional regulator [Nocardia sp. CDC153]